MSEAEVLWTTGRRRLLKDPHFGSLVKSVGPIRWPARAEDPFFYLCRAIVYQQLAGKAAQTIHGRFLDALKGEVTPAKILRVRETTLRKAGLSRAKLAAVRDLSAKVRDGEVVLDDLDQAEDADVVRWLTVVKGIGPWTADMFLMFHLKRPDVWPVGDLGVRAGLAALLEMDEPPTQKEMEPLGDPYKPWRSPAAWYCWRALEVETP